MKYNEDIKAEKVQFSANCCFAFDNGAEDKHCLKMLADYLISKGPNLAAYGQGRFFHYLLNHSLALQSHIKFVIEDSPGLSKSEVRGIVVIRPGELPADVKTVFLCETLTFPRMQMQRRLPRNTDIITADVLADLDLKSIPQRAWIPFTENIYQQPFDLPEIEFLPGQDIILIDCPSRNLALMPNGLAYVHNALKRAGIKFQTVDLDIIIYHRYHIYRLFDTCGKVFSPNGKEMPEDPWMTEKMGVWDDRDTLDFFQPEIDEIIDAIVKARPKVLGLSIQQCNTKFSSEVVAGVKKKLPDTMILVGGYSCYFPYIGRNAFPQCDYMVIGEADLIVGDLVRRLAAGDRPRNLPGVMSRFDSPEHEFVPGPIPHDLDALDFPKYEWIDLSCYRNYSHYRLTPITGSRGCRWGRCRFCGEARLWRGRDPKKFADELEWLYDHGCDLFVFNESDMSGEPELLKDICREIIRRGLKVRLSGQLRIDRRNTPEFLEVLRQAGFISMRFGVDGWSNNTLKLQNKGYNVKLVSQNLRNCWEVGIPVEVNAVVGVPMETDDDISESIQLMLQNKKYIWRLANINPLVLVTGSIYWRNPEKYNIHFRGNKDEIYKKHLFNIPSDLWYSTEPYIDSNVRLERCKRILHELKEKGFDFGPGAEPKVEDYLGDVKAVEVEEAEKKSVALAEIKTEGRADTAANRLEQAAMVIRNKNDFYRVDAKRFCDKDMLAAKSPFYSVVGILLNKVISAGRDSAVRKAYLGRIRRYLHLVYRDRNLRTSLFLMREKLKALYVRHSSPLDSVKPVPLTHMIKQNFNGYNLIRVRSDYYAIKHGYSFDIDRFEAGMYEEGICFKATRIKDLEDIVNTYLRRDTVQV